MADYAYPNRIRAYTALLIYRDAMRRYIADTLSAKHGSNWFHDLILKPLSEKGGRDHSTRIDEAEVRGRMHHQLIDHVEIALLIDRNLNEFRGLNKSEVKVMEAIRSLRNTFLEHDFEEGDCAPEVASAIADQCTLILDQCGLPDAAEAIRDLSRTSGTPAGQPVSESVSHDGRAPSGHAEVIDDLGSPSLPPTTEALAVTTDNLREWARTSHERTETCLCGCGRTTKSTFRLGHEGRLLRIIRSGSDAERASVDWQRVPLTFYNGDYAKEIRRYQRNQASR